MNKTTFLAALTLLFLLLINTSSESCTNILVSRGATVDSSVIITYNADAGGFMEPLYYEPAKDHEPGDSVEIYEWDTGKFLGKIPQVAHTFAVVGNMNEHQVSIGETTYTGRKELKDTNALIDYGSLMWLAMHRAKTAREALDVMTSLVEEFGYYSSGESFSISDPDEVWILEMISKGPEERGAVWVARRVPDGYICVHANQARIHEFPMDDPENCIYSPDVIDFAIEKGYYDPDDGPFSFSKAYNPLDPGGALYCEGRVWSVFRRAAPSLMLDKKYWRAYEGEEPYPLFIKPDKKLSVEDVISLMRDHFEGTEYDMTKGLGSGPFGCPYRWKPLQWQLSTDTVNSYGWGRPVSTQQTAFAFASQSRNWLPDEIGGCFWYGVDDNYTNVYMPLYCCMNRVPKTLQAGSISEFTLESAFWVFNLVANLAYTKYSYVYEDIRPVQEEIEGQFHDSREAVENAALTLYKQDKQLAVNFLTDYSVSQVNKTVDTWRDLWKQLVVKYNDGYINDVNVDNGRHPKGVSYGDYYLKKVLEERPGYYDVKWRKK